MESKKVYRFKREKPGKQPGFYNMNCRQKLDYGLYLEDRGFVLPWGAREQDLIEQVPPDRLAKTISWDELYWAHPVVFNGMQADLLEVVIYPYGWFDSAWLWLERGACIKKATYVFEKSLDHLARTLGPPHDTHPSGPCCPFSLLAAWEWQQMRLNLFLQPGDEFEEFPYTCAAHIARRIPERGNK